MGNTSLGSQVIPNFTFQSGHIPILGELRSGLSFYPLHSNLVIFQLNNADFRFLGIADFTFQSGHIPIKSTSPVGKGSRNFTFQSGHIPILSLPQTPQNCYPLHSNLVIFQLIKNPLVRAIAALYIPIWSYSNELLTPDFVFTMHFTFQSGHIPIFLSYESIIAYSSLHSNLVIFQSRKQLRD